METIAVSHEMGILVSTVLGHLFEAFKAGRPLNLYILSVQAKAKGMPPPLVFQWRQLDMAAKSLISEGSAASQEPWNVPLSALLSHLPDSDVSRLFSGTPSAANGSKPTFTQAEADTRALWFNLAKWWQTLTKCGCIPVEVISMENPTVDYQVT
jgi:hypothetical protein